MSGYSGLVTRVLVVDDDPDMRQLQRLNLEICGFTCLEAASGTAALELIRDGAADLMLLDVSMPGVDGMDTLRALRRTDDIPVILVTSHSDTAHIQLAFELGADDYVIKPFVAGELIARIKAVLRRTQPHPNRAADDEAASEDAGLCLDLRGRRVVVEGDEVPMTRREFDVLATLAADPGKAFSRDELLRRVWESQSGWQDPATVTEHIHRLRAKLAPSGRGRCIETVRGVGYRYEPANADHGSALV